ncbi:hypothetical protein [Anaerovorax odorimutans]|uniref:hypothetical protein n=1 Tax=Anaerovorax odorimutans TaxID=109327 RepID=UPI00041C5788|nr:hypothetical protein [Anaerovorax odorimutans]
MNPILILIIILIFGNQGGINKSISEGKVKAMNLKIPSPPTYFDTFKMELFLDRMHSITNALEKINHLNQVRQVPMNKSNYLDRIQDSLDAVRGFLSENKTSNQIDNISNTISGVKKFGDIENIMSTMAPIISMLTNNSEN